MHIHEHSFASRYFVEPVQPLLPSFPPGLKGGRPRLPDRACLTGILFVLRSGIPWEMLPQELGCGSGMTCWRRLRDWQEAGIWQLMHFVLLDWLARLVPMVFAGYTGAMPFWLLRYKFTCSQAECGYHNALDAV